MNNALNYLNHQINELYHLDLSVYDELFLDKTLKGRKEATGAATYEAYVAHLLEDPVELSRLTESLTNCYSEFFRNPLTFALLEQFVIPNLFSTKEQNHGRELRIWSAGCSAGQEPYSVAILADDYRRFSGTRTGFTIFATDYSERILEIARRGIYDESALKNTRLTYINRYFHKQQEHYRIIPDIMEQVDFSCYDLLDSGSGSPPASIYGGFDLVLCSNVLYYYSPEIKKRMLEKIIGSLNPGGFLVTSEAEKSIVKLARGFRQFAPPAPIFVKT